MPPRLITTNGSRPPGEGATVASDDPAAVGDRVVYRDQKLWLDGFLVAANGEAGLVVVLNVPQLIPCPITALRVVERGALLRNLQLG